MSNTTKDGKRATAGMIVYGISPWADIETMYVQLDQISASTTSPTDERAASCTFPVSNCYSSKCLAERVAMTYVEDMHGYMVPPEHKE